MKGEAPTADITRARADVHKLALAHVSGSARKDEPMRHTHHKTRGTRTIRHTTAIPQAQAQSRPPINAMTSQELRAWISATRAALQQKIARERAYLDRRAARGSYTPTDQAYEADQLLEADLVALLNAFEQHVAGLEPEGGTGR